MLLREEIMSKNEPCLSQCRKVWTYKKADGTYMYVYGVLYGSRKRGCCIFTLKRIHCFLKVVTLGFF